jgi:hypothetical protein
MKIEKHFSICQLLYFSFPNYPVIQSSINKYTLKFKKMGMSFRYFLTVLGMTTTLLSCHKEADTTSVSDTTQTTSSSSGTTNLGSSHNTGKNCLSCHKFTVGGSIYKKDLASAYPGSVVNLTTQVNGAGTVVATLTTDNSGNIHTSNSIGFGTWLYVSVTGSAGTKYMSSTITSGGCNACHGSTTSKAWTE